MTEPLTIIVDSREQAPLIFGPGVEVTIGTLTSGDYSIRHLEDRCAIERKSMADLAACVGPERDRFQRELIRLRGYPCRALVVEASLQDILAHSYRSQTAPAAVLGSLAAWATRYQIPVWFCGDPAGAAAVTLAILRNYRREVHDLLRKLDSDSNQPAGECRAGQHK